MSQPVKSGIIVRSRSGFYTVHTDSCDVTCQMRGRLKEERLNSSLAAVGDKVEISLLPDGSGVLESILPREKAFFRMAPTARGEFKQVMLANPDQVVLVFACENPAPSFRMLDRFLVITEKQKIPGNRDREQDRSGGARSRKEAVFGLPGTGLSGNLHFSQR